MKKSIYKVTTKYNSRGEIYRNIRAFNVVAKNMKEAIKRVEMVLKKDYGSEYVDNVEHILEIDL